MKFSIETILVPFEFFSMADKVSDIYPYYSFFFWEFFISSLQKAKRPGFSYGDRIGKYSLICMNTQASDLFKPEEVKVVD